jgi:2'-5' RNA ligase
LAIDLSESVRVQVAGVVAPWSGSPDARWVRTEKLHLTLVFLGNLPASDLDEARRAIDGVALGTCPFFLSVCGSGTFETARAPSVFWFGVGGDLEALKRLQQKAAAHLRGGERGGVARDELQRPYVPHVTLARAKRGHPFQACVEALRRFESSLFEVRQLHLYESKADAYRSIHVAAF